MNITQFTELLEDMFPVSIASARRQKNGKYLVLFMHTLDDELKNKIVDFANGIGFAEFRDNYSMEVVL